MNKSPASFRDQAGFVFRYENNFYRKIKTPYKETYEALLAANLFNLAVNENLLLPFSEGHIDVPSKYYCDETYKIIKPEQLNMVTYPYEWTFNQIKDAAILTLNLQLLCLQNNFILKDASIYNVQFYKNKPVFIDHLSIEKLEKYNSWQAYGQFCAHFLAPLALMAYVDVNLNKLLRCNIDGIDLGLTVKLLPKSKLFKPGLLMHLYLHALSQKKYANTVNANKGNKKCDKQSLIHIARSLKSTIESIKLKKSKTKWSDYYDKNTYSRTSMHAKEKFVENMVFQYRPKIVWDFGANTGRFSTIAAAASGHVLAMDLDHNAVDDNYQQLKQEQISNIQPLVIDLTNPTSRIGFAERERYSLSDRGPACMALALGLIHHLVITNNIPFDMVAKYFADNCVYLIIEYIPKMDSQIDRLLSTKCEKYEHYNSAEFEYAFTKYFRIIHSEKIISSERVMFLMQSKLVK